MKKAVSILVLASLFTLGAHASPARAADNDGGAESLLQTCEDLWLKIWRAQAKLDKYMMECEAAPTRACVLATIQWMTAVDAMRGKYNDLGCDEIAAPLPPPLHPNTGGVVNPDSSYHVYESTISLPELVNP